MYAKSNEINNDYIMQKVDKKLNSLISVVVPMYFEEEVAQDAIIV